jgi:DNA-binding PadR family transcriptional regulator
MLGELEQIVMLAVLRVGDEAYGVSIRSEIEQRSRRELTLATVYKTLGRLEDKGLVTSYEGDPTPQRGGRRKRFYDLTPAGKRELKQSVGVLRRMASGLDLGWET